MRVSRQPRARLFDSFRAAFLGVVGLSVLAAIGCGPSLDPALKADIDQRVSGLRAGSERVGAPAGATAQPLVPGQWTTHKIVDEKGQPGFFTYKVVGQDGDATWVETVNETYTGKTITKMLVAFGDRRSLDSIDIRAVTMRDARGRVSTIDGPALQMMRGLYKSSLNGLVVSWQGLPQEDAAVIAGVFVGCFKTQSSVSFGPLHRESLTWSHPAVPISGLVRSQSLDGHETMELVAFGETGAVSDL